jgi:3-hydroxymyristoyl/3-hydroxydecanoyl-(acyl carrier protein) dehydratase
MKSVLEGGQDVVKLIPQSFPFVMIDKLISTDEEVTQSGFLILADNVLCSNGYFSASGLTENIAQTAAVRGGYLAKLNGTDPNIGFIGAIKKLKIYQLPKVGDHLKTTITIKNRVLNFSLISGQVVCNDEVMAECEMRIFEKAD